MTSDAVVFECALDAPPEKVWRALTIPEYVERWLSPKGVEAKADGISLTGPAERIDCTVVTAETNKRLTYRWREVGEGAIQGAEDSVVTFELTPTANGGTWFRLTHAPMAVPVAANSNISGPTMMAA